MCDAFQIFMKHFGRAAMNYFWGDFMRGALACTSGLHTKFFPLCILLEESLQALYR